MTFYSSLKKTVRRLISRNQVQIPERPLSDVFGLDRGTPIDRYYMKMFFKSNSQHIKGVCGEFGDVNFTRQWGHNLDEIICFNGEGKGADSVELDLTVDNLDPDFLGKFDTIICTNVLNFIFDIQVASENLMKMLKPGGKAIITVSGLSARSNYDYSRWGDFWRMSDLGLMRLFAKNKIIVSENFGNFYSAVHFLNGSAAEEIACSQLLQNDVNYSILSCMVVEKIDEV